MERELSKFMDGFAQHLAGRPAAPVDPSLT